MPRRIEVELTSRRDDNTWTWRAAGARQPKGMLDGSLLYDGVAVGDVVRAEAEIGVDGIELVAVLPPKDRKPDTERLEIIGQPVPEGGVTTSLVPGSSSRGRERRGGDPKGGRRPRSGREGREGHAPREGREGREGREPKRERQPRAKREAPTRPKLPDKPKPKRLRPGRTHRNEWLRSLSDEQRPVAEQLVRGGMASVRKEIDAEIDKARRDGRPEISAEPLITMAEQLVGGLHQAEWRDRAESALAEVDELDLRDLRTVVVAADDWARDPAARELADQLRSSLTQRVEAAQKEWLDELSALLSDGRVVRALRLSSRPPKAGEPLPPDLAQRLTDAANEALQGDVGRQRLGVVIDAVAFSPVRQKVELAEAPANPGDELLGTIRKVAQQVPQIAAKFGVEPVSPRRGPRRNRDRPPAPPPPPAGVAEAVAAGPTEVPAEAAVVEPTEPAAPAEGPEASMPAEGQGPESP